MYLRPFPGGPGKWRVSSNSGQEPRWRSDGKELFYLVPSGPTRRQLMAVPVQTAMASLTMGVPQKLFEFPALGIVPQDNIFLYSPAAGGGRFLIQVLANTAEPKLNVIVNWEKAAMQTSVIDKS